MPFIKFKHENLRYKGMATDAVISTDHIVKVVVDYYQVGADGQRYQTYVEDYGLEQMKAKIERHFILFDVLGTEYDSLHATPEGLKIIVQLWGSAV